MSENILRNIHQLGTICKTKVPTPFLPESDVVYGVPRAYDQDADAYAPPRQIYKDGIAYITHLGMLDGNTSEWYATKIERKEP